MTASDVLGISGLSLAFLSGRLTPSAALEAALDRIASAGAQLWPAFPR